VLGMRSYDLDRCAVFRPLDDPSVRYSKHIGLVVKCPHETAAINGLLGVLDGDS
jgi:hypothetical protein